MTQAWCKLFILKALDIYWPIEGKVFGQSHWKSVIYKYDMKDEKGNTHQVDLETFADTSILGKETEGDVPLYRATPCYFTYICSITNIALAPIYTLGVILYNILRIIPVVVYISGHLFYHYAQLPKDSEQTFSAVASFHLKAMGNQVALSISNVIRTPYFALNYTFGLFYSLVDPLNGRKWTGIFERAWNHQLSLRESYWSVRGAGKDFAFEGGGAIEKLAHHAFYMMGCLQPVTYAHFREGECSYVIYRSGNIRPVEEQRKFDDACPCIPIGCKI